MTSLLTLKIGDFVEFIDREKEQGFSALTLSDSAQWYCVVVSPNCHRRVELELSRLGFRSFYPKLRKWVTHARTKKAVERPILGRYVFVEIDMPRQHFATINAVRDIERMVTNLGAPVTVQSHWVEGLFLRYIKGEFDEIQNGELPVGARVIVVEGEFENQLATVSSIHGKKSDLKLLGGKTEVRISSKSVRAA